MQSYETLSAIARLQERSQAFGPIVDAIDTIADQTNLLALKVAIEAARPDEHGRGLDDVSGIVEANLGVTARIGTGIDPAARAAEPIADAAGTLCTFA